MSDTVKCPYCGYEVEHNKFVEQSELDSVVTLLRNPIEVQCGSCDGIYDICLSILDIDWHVEVVG